MSNTEKLIQSKDALKDGIQGKQVRKLPKLWRNMPGKLIVT